MRLQAPLGNRPALDGVRAVAIITVMISHSRIPGLPGGIVGVDLFFVLSGFLISTLLLEEHARCGEIDILAFYARRVLRLTPAVVAMLASVFFLSFVPALAEATPVEVLRFGAYVLTYTSNWAVALRAGHTPSLLGHLWSLSVEEQFYLVWPLVLLAALYGGLRLRTMLVIVLVSVAGLALWRSTLWNGTHDAFRVYFSTDCRATGLLLGCALGILREMGVRPSRRWCAALAAAGVMLFAWSAAHVYRQISYPLLLGLTREEAAAAAMIAGLGFTEIGRYAQPFAWAPLVWIGRRSYAMYLWHVPMLYVAYHTLPGGDVATTAVGFALTLGVTVLSWRFIEQPALRYRRRFERHGPAADLSLVPLPA